MRILTQVVALSLLSSAGPASAQTAAIRCSVTENGAPGHGTVAVEQDGREVVAGSCDGKLTVPPGKSKVIVRLDGALDNPSKTLRVDLAAAKTTPITVNFETGVLEVRIEAKTQRGTGLVTVNRSGKRIGTLGSGVAARLSAGNYEVLVRMGGEEKMYTVDLKPGQRRLVRAQF